MFIVYVEKGNNVSSLLRQIILGIVTLI